MHYEESESREPILQLKTNRGLLKFILLNLITLGIYSIVFYTRLGKDINEIAGPHDGRHTTHFCYVFFFVSLATCGIATFVWFHRISARIGRDLGCRGIAYQFGALDYWLWNVLGSLFLIGPFVYTYRLCKAMNLLSADHNINGYACSPHLGEK